MAIILGIDPGSRVTGYGVIRQVGRQLSYLGSGCIRTKVDDLPSRLKLIYAGVSLPARYRAKATPSAMTDIQKYFQRAINPLVSLRTTLR